MRNWNTITKIVLAQPPASRLPMRNWNWAMDKKPSLPVMLPDYLWGIETPSESPQHSEEAASRLPMRNWNLNEWGFRYITTSFQTTYEELKLQTFAASLSGNFFSLPDYLWGIETQRGFSLYPSFSSASRLPMRNWNINFSLMVVASASLPDYLWGIETLRADQVDTRGFWCFQTTYEELKHSRKRGTYRMIKLPDYLWGIETLRVVRDRIRTHEASRLPMRNWNSIWKPAA